MKQKKISNNGLGDSQALTEQDPSNLGYEMPSDNAKEITNSLIIDNIKIFNLQNNKKILNGFEIFLQSQYSNKLLVDCPSRFYEILANIYQSKAKHQVSTINKLTNSNLEDALRSKILIKSKTVADTYEGEVTDVRMIKNVEGDVEEITITLRSSKGSKDLKVSKFLYKIIAEINIGDMIYAEGNSGLIRRLGRCESRMNDYDLEADRYIQLNKGPVYNKKYKEIIFSLYDMDYAFNEYNSEIGEFIRKYSDELLDKYLSEGVVNLLENTIILTGIEYFTKDDFFLLENYIEQCPWIKFVLMGDIKRVINTKLIRNTMRLEMKDEESQMELMKFKNSKLSDPSLEESVKRYLKNDNFDLIDDILQLSENAEDFNKIAESQILNQ